MKRLALVLPVLLISFACGSTRVALSGGSVVVMATPPSPSCADSDDCLRVGNVHVTARGGDRIAFFEVRVFEDEDGDGLPSLDETLWSEATLNGPLEFDVDLRTGADTVCVTERTRQLVRIELESGLELVEVWRVTREGLLPL